MKNVPVKTEAPPVRILKIATCPSLSGRSTLTYHIGCRGDSAIQFRIYANTGRGFFSREWISTDMVQRGFEKNREGTPITSSSLGGIFRGKSVNTQGFLLAILKAEGLITPFKGKGRGYERVDSRVFVEDVTSLMKSPVSLKDNDKPGVPAKTNKTTTRKGTHKKA